MRRSVPCTQTILLLTAGLALAPRPALAQHNTTRIVVPASGMASDTGAARLYPSTIEVAPGDGDVYAVSVTLHNITHDCFSDLDILLAAPNGKALVLMSDAGGCAGVTQTRTITIDETVTTYVPKDHLPDGGRFRPTDYLDGWPDSFPNPAPGAQTGGYPFRGSSPAGSWRLFVMHSQSGHRGEIQAWTLAVGRQHGFESTTHIAVPNGAPSETHGTASTYPATIVASGVTGRLVKVLASVGFAHEDPDDLDVLLVGPGGHSAVLMSDVGGYTDVPPPSGTWILFDDDGPDSLPDASPLNTSAYWFRPTDHAPGDIFEAPAPAGPQAASLAVFKNAPANGSWSLFARDDAYLGAGTIYNWGVTLVTVSSPQPPMLQVETPGTFPTTSPFVDITADVDDASDALVTWRNAASGNTGVALHEHSTIFGARVPVVAGSNAITFTLTNAAGEQTSKTVTATVGHFAYTFAEGATGPFFDLDVTVFNPNLAPTPFDVTFLTPGGALGPKSYVLSPRSRLRLPVETLANEFPMLADTAVSTVVASTKGTPLVTERAMFWDGSRYGGHAGTAAPEASTWWMFAEGSQGFFDTFVLLANATAAAATTTVTFLLEDGPPVTRTYTVPPHSRFNVWAAGIPELSNRSFGITVQSSVPITAERAMYFSGASARQFEGGHESAGVTRGAREWFFAEGATGPYFDTYILVSNPNTTSVPVTFTYRTGDGTVVSKQLTAGPHSRVTVNVEAHHPALANVAVSTTVSAPLPIVAERAMYWPGTPATWTEAHNSFGLTGTGERWAVADGRVGGPEAFETYLLIVNPEPVDARVRLTFTRAGLSSPVQKWIVVPANTRANVTLATHAPEVLDGAGPTEFSALVETTNLTRIAVERATYWDSGGFTWAGGANVTATPLR